MRYSGTLRLAEILMEPDISTARALSRKWKKKNNQSRSAALHELKELDHILLLGTGKGLTQFIPSYFADGFKSLRPGHFADWLEDPEAEYVPLSDRHMLRILKDREKVGGAYGGYLCSRLRCMEVDDPAHILWRIASLSVAAAGLKGSAI